MSFHKKYNNLQSKLKTLPLLQLTKMKAIKKAEIPLILARGSLDLW